MWWLKLGLASGGGLFLALIVYNLWLTYPLMAWSDLLLGFLRPKHWYIAPPRHSRKAP